MLAHLPPFIQKLWDKGIDISASLIVTGVTALIALASWKIKLWLDLMADDAKDRRKNKRDQEFARERQKEQFRDRDARLLRERATLADEAAKVVLKIEFLSVTDRYTEWLKSNQLEHLPANAQHATQIAAWRNLALSPAQLPGLSIQLAELIAKTELPPKES